MTMSMTTRPEALHPDIEEGMVAPKEREDRGPGAPKDPKQEKLL